MPLYRTPELDLEDQHVLDALDAMRAELDGAVKPSRRWTGGLRRTSQARAIQGSNTIEGYTVTDDDAAAAVDDDEPLTADQRTWAEIIGYRRLLTFIVNVATDPTFQVDEHTLRTMHFMLLEHDLGKGPGGYRSGAVYVQREFDGRTLYEGPDPDQLAELMAELSQALADRTGPAPVRAAMAHLNLVMIHPFRDGNGRMARALQTLVLAQDSILEPTFASIEEWLGANTDDYYRVLAVTGRGSWQPENDAHLWVKFCLRAHHMQAQTLARRVDEAAVLGDQVLVLLGDARLPERAFDPLFDAARGLRVRRSTYVKRSGIEERTASRDLKALVDAGLLVAEGATKGRTYRAGGDLLQLGRELRAARPELVDPYPWMTPELLRLAAERPESSSAQPHQVP